MKPKIEDALVQAALKNEQGRDDFIKALKHIPLNKENFDTVLQCAMISPAQQWVIEFYTPELMHILSNPHGWDDWAEDFPFLDELILSASHDPRWMDVLSFRWTISDGRPEGGPRSKARTKAERSDFFSECWNATIANDNAPRLEQMLNHPVWKTTLTEECMRLALWRPLEVWRVFHDNHQQLPLRSFWQGMMIARTNSDNHSKLHFLITEAGSTVEFMVQQYTHFWHHPLPQDLNDVFKAIVVGVVPNEDNIKKLHQNIVNCLFKKDRLPEHLCVNDINTILHNIPFFDGRHFILALINCTVTHLDGRGTEVVEAVFNNLDNVVQSTLLGTCMAHPLFEHVAFAQKRRIEHNIESDDTAVRVKKI